jgi:integrase
MAATSRKKNRQKPARYQLWIPTDLQPLFGGKQSQNKVLSGVAPRDVARTKTVMQALDEQLFSELERLSAERRAAIIAAGGIARLPARIGLLEGQLAYCEGVAKAIATLPQDIPDIPPDIIVDSLRATQAFAQARKEARADLAMLQPIALRAAPAPAFTFDALYTLWLNKGCKRTRNHIRTRDLLKAHFGNVDYRTVTRPQVHDFRKWLALQGIALTSQNAILTAVKSMFSEAVDNGDIGDNPAHGVKVKGISNVPRDGFTGTQLSTILEKAAETKFGGARHVEVMWLLRLAIWSGLRINEIAQLRRDDVGFANGVPFLHIREGEGQSVKTGAGRRVPLHPACADFVDYAKASKTNFIFGAFPAQSSNGRAYWLIQTFGKFMRETCGITEGKLTLHSMRKSFHRAMSDARLHPDAQRYLVGHAGKDVHDKNYNTSQALRLLAEEIAGVDPLKIEG